MTTQLIERLGVTEVRETPDGLERCGIYKPPSDGFISVVTLAFRTGRDRPWLEASAGSVALISPERWSKWPIVEGEVLG
jgi:hypothetical protein